MVLVPCHQIQHYYHCCLLNFHKWRTSWTDSSDPKSNKWPFSERSMAYQVAKTMNLFHIWKAPWLLHAAEWSSKLKRFKLCTSLIPVMKLDITGNNGLHDAFQLFMRNLSKIYHQLMNLVLLSSDLRLIRQILCFASSTVRSILTRSIHEVPVRRYCLYLCHLHFLTKINVLLEKNTK